MKRCRKRRKARKRQIEHENYTLEEIAARDNFRCGICCKKVLMNKVVPHFKAPTIDHLIPVSEGGDDVKANVQLAHFICNSRRGTGGTVQLLLVG
jgi:5-methylcytosine-specific restriction endonuclease McrA